AVLIGRLAAQSNARRGTLVAFWWPSHSGFFVHARNVQTKLEKASVFGCWLHSCWYNSRCRRKPGAADNDPRRQTLRRTRMPALQLHSTTVRRIGKNRDRGQLYEAGQTDSGASLTRRGQLDSLD